MELFQYLELPLDEEDYRYVQSFTVDQSGDQQVQEFFNTYGLVVFRDSISQEQCNSTVSDMWNLLEDSTPGLDRSNSTTWTRGWSQFGMPKNTPSHVLFRPSLLRLRQHPNVVRCFQNILQTENIICSHDRWLMHRPTMLSGVFRSDWATRPNVHLDLNPGEYFDPKQEKAVLQRLSALRYGSRKNRAFVSENNDVHFSMGRSVQGILNLTDLPSTQDGGGTLVVPGSHSSLERWVELHQDELPKTVGPTQHKFDDGLLKKAQRVTMRPGSLVIWDQRLIHGSGTNLSHSLRCGVPIRFFSSSQLDSSKGRKKDRANTVAGLLRKEGFDSEVTDLGRLVFGLESRNW